MTRLGGDFWVGLVVLTSAIIYWLEADKIRISPLDGPVNAAGPPKALAYALGSLAIILVVRSLAVAIMGGGRPPSRQESVSIRQLLHPHLRAIGMLAIGVGYLLLVSWLGYVITIVALILAVSIYNGAAPGWRTAAVAIGGAIFFHLFFVEFLGIPLPAGILQPVVG